MRDNLDVGVFDLNMPALDPIIAAADKRLAGKDPFGAFESSLEAVNASTESLDRFYSKNYEDYIGL